MGRDLGGGAVGVEGRAPARAAGSPRVSVLMGVYNGGAHLGEAVESILGQTFPDLELIVVDDGSTDETRAVLAAYPDERMRVLHQDHAGLTRALNHALGKARGEYVARQDADDVSHPTRIERQVRFLDAHPEIALVGTWVQLIDGDGDELATLHFETEPARIAALLPRENHFTHGTLMARRTILQAIGGYREAFRYAQDYDLTLRLIERYALGNLPEELYRLRQGADKISYRRGGLQVAYATLARRLWAERERGGVDGVDAGRPFEELLPPVEEPDALAYHRQMAYFYLRAGRLAKARCALRELVARGGADLGTWLGLGVSLTGPWLAPRLVRWWDRVRGGSRVFQ